MTAVKDSFSLYGIPKYTESVCAICSRVKEHNKIPSIYLKHNRKIFRVTFVFSASSQASIVCAVLKWL